MFKINISNTLADNLVRATVRWTVEEDTLFGKKKDSWTEERSFELVGGCVLGRNEVLCTVFGQKVTTMVVEGIEGLSLPLTTEVSERHTPFGTNSTTIVRIMTVVEAALNGAGTLRPSRPMPGRTFEKVSITVKRVERPRR